MLNELWIKNEVLAEILPLLYMRALRSLEDQHVNINERNMKDAIQYQVRLLGSGIKRMLDEEESGSVIGPGT